MQVPFFPGPVFGWTFYLALMGLLAVTAYVDWRTMVVPKQLSLAALAAGLLMNLVRGSWLGARGEEVWGLGRHGAWVGAVDGLGFALAGALLGFGIFFVLWVMGVCGGGDVKLFAALGAWVGPTLAVCVLIGTVVVVLAWTLGVVAAALPALLLRQALAAVGLHGALPGKPAGPPGPRKRYLTYSFPVALATALVLLWMLRVDLHLAAPRTAPADTVEAHAR